MDIRTEIESRLRTVKYPGFSRDIVSFGIIREIQIEGKSATIDIVLQTNDESVADQIRKSCQEALESLEQIESFQIRTVRQPTSAPAAGGLPAAEPIAGVRHIIAVASGKGGVGKSTVAANLAVAFAGQGLRVGLCDCDIYGPSMGLMFGTHENPEATEDEQIIPVERYGIALMSMGLLADPSSPAILRGPMVTRFTQQFLRGVVWGDLDVLVLDLPPGTGDIQLTIVQTIALAGAVIVTTPQEVALIDARKAVAMFQKVHVPILGLIENMSYFECPSDGQRYGIFGEGGGEREAKRLGVPLLAQLPIDISTCQAGDAGKPITLSSPHSPTAKLFNQAAQSIWTGIQSA